MQFALLLYQNFPQLKVYCFCSRTFLNYQQVWNKSGPRLLILPNIVSCLPLPNYGNTWSEHSLSVIIGWLDVIINSEGV